MGVGARARGKGQRMKTESKREWVITVHSWKQIWRPLRIQVISSMIQMRKQRHKLQCEVARVAEQDLVLHFHVAYVT